MDLIDRETFAAMVSYNVVVGDTATKVILRLLDVVPEDFSTSRTVVVLMATLFISIPLCLYRDIAKLAKISFLSLVCNVFILYSIFMRMGTMRAKM